MSPVIHDQGIVHRHSPALGGMRKPRRDSRNTMCAEAVWWKCHRQLVADALVARGVKVRHIMGLPASSAGAGATAPAHTLTDFAQIADGLVTYRRLIG